MTAVCKSDNGELAEWFKATVLKTVEGESLPWVRIPDSLLGDNSL